MASSLASPSVMESVQQNEDGSPRFRVSSASGWPHWEELVEKERAGGYQAEIRAFLDAQLEPDDCFVDTAVGPGMVLLSALTAPGGSPQVLAIGDGAEDCITDHAGIESDNTIEWWALSSLLDGRLARHLVRSSTSLTRVFIHTDLRSLPYALPSLSPLYDSGRIAAVCVSVIEANMEEDRLLAARLLRESGYTIYELREGDDGPALFESSTIGPAIPVFAIPALHNVGTDDGHSRRDSASTPTGTRSEGRRRSFSVMAPYCRTGYGIAGANLVRELSELEADVAFFPIGQIDRSVVHTADLDVLLNRRQSFDHYGPSVRLWQQFDLATHVGKGPRVGFPIFELNGFTAGEIHHLRSQDMLLVTCEWARDVLRDNGITVPTELVPLGVDRTVFNEDVVPVGRPNDDTVFLQVGKLEARKGQLDTLRAFESAFTPSDRVRLVLMCHNPFISEREMQSMLKPFRDSPMSSRIRLITSPFPTQTALSRHMAASDCGVFPSRAEGWNLEALEMLALGKSVIAANYSAHTAYLHAANAMLVDIDDLEHPAGITTGRWAAWGENQHEQVVAHMRSVHGRKQAGALGINLMGVATSRKLSWRNAAVTLISRISDL